MNMKRIYLASRYSRRVELCGYRNELQNRCFDVQARWLNGTHQLDNAGAPIGDNGEALIEAGNCERANALRAEFANDDWEDVTGAEVVINFTEPPRSSANRGGRHVECGIGLALGKRTIVIGYRENIFHWLPQVEFFETWEAFLATL